jgi:ABC-type sugar transport system, permease component
MEKENRIKNKNGFDIFNFIFLGILTIITIFPFYYVLLISVSDYASANKQLIYIFPTYVNFDSYRLVFEEKAFLNSFLVSVFVTVVGTAFSMFLTMTAAYTLSKKFVPGNKILFTIALIPMFFSGGLIPFYITVQKVGLTNNIFSMIIPAAVSAFYLILLKNYFDDVPVSLEESAKIDGANDMYIFFKIVVPTSIPVVVTISLFYAVDKWNEYFSAMLFISDRNLYPLQLVLREILQNFSQFMGGAMGQEIQKDNMLTYTMSLQMAIVTITTIPIICVYPFLQKHFTKGIMLGAIKE